MKHIISGLVKDFIQDHLSRRDHKDKRYYEKKHYSGHTVISGDRYDDRHRGGRPSLYSVWTILKPYKGIFLGCIGCVTVIIIILIGVAIRGASAILPGLLSNISIPATVGSGAILLDSSTVSSGVSSVHTIISTIQHRSSLLQSL